MRLVFVLLVALAAVPALCAFLGIFIFGGFQIASIGVRPSLTGAAIEAVAGYVLTLVMAYVLAVVIDALAPRFGGVATDLGAPRILLHPF